MACGTPVLATAVGGIPEIIRHQVTGFSLPACDSNTIADSILMALNHPDPWAIGEHGRCHVLARYSLAASSEKWGAVLEELTWKQLEHSTVHAP
jgi:colanic acid/amylovoran biosynthesis glycosyltransferase